VRVLAKKLLRVAVLCASIVVVVESCKDMGNEPASVPNPPLAGGLTAVPPSVTVGSGVVATVSIRGGSAPYSIGTPPNTALVSAILTDSTLSITGVTVASAAGATSVKVVDSSPTPVKYVTVPVTKTYP